MLEERLKIWVIEPYHGLYRNLLYLVKKSTPKKYRLVNIAVELNQVSVRDANLPSSADEFSEKFIVYTIFFLIDFFLGYNQADIHEESRDLTTFMTSLGFMRMTTLPQGATNSITQFGRIVLEIFAPYLQDQAKPFLDNLRVKGPKIKYNNEEVAPGIKGYVFEYIKNLNNVLVDLKRVGVTITGAKSQFC